MRLSRLGRGGDYVLFALTLLLVFKWSSALRNALVWVSFLVFLARSDLRKVHLRESLPLLFSALFLGWALLSVSYSMNPAISARDWIKTAESVAAAWVIAQVLWNPDDLEKCLWYFFLALTMIFVIDGASYVYTFGLDWQRGDRWTPPPHFIHANLYSGLIVASLPLALIARRAGALGHATIVANVATSLFLLAVFASRDAQLTLIGLLGVFALLRPRRQKVLGASLVLALLVAMPLINPRFTDATMITLSNRFENWANTSRLISERPLLGYGFGARNYFQVYGEHYPDRTEPFPHPHNAFLDVCFSTGFVGLGLFVATQATALIALWKVRRSGSETERRLSLVMILCLSSVLIFSLADVPTGPLSLYSWLLIGAASGLCAHSQGRKTPAIRRSSPSATNGPS